MGFYTEYLNNELAGQKLNLKKLTDERKKELKEISRLRGNRDLLVIAGDMYHKPKSTSDSATIEPNDLMWIVDQLDELPGAESLDVILETPGGSGEVVEDIGKLLRSKYERIGMIIPGTAKSAGTILAMCGDEILMGPASALGPIDAQIPSPQGRAISVHSFLEGFDKIKRETIQEGRLNAAYIPMLQRITPGDLQDCMDLKNFATRLVTNWLVSYKFKYWEKHSSTGQPVTEEEKRIRAEQIATELGNKSRWLTHGRSIKIEDLDSLGLKVENFTDKNANKEVAEHILRYYTLLKITLNETNIFKLFETPTTQIIRFQQLQAVPVQAPGQADIILLPIPCHSCGNIIDVQMNFTDGVPVKPGFILADAKLKTIKCPHCGFDNNLTPLIEKIEKDSGRKVV